MLGLFLLLSLQAEPETGIIESPIGNGKAGFSGDGGPAESAQLNGPFDVAFDQAGNLYFSDTFNHRIRRVDAASGIITTVAGNGSKGFSGDGGPATEAAMDEPYGLVIDQNGNLYFVDRLNRRVRRVDAGTGEIATVAGNGRAEYSGDGGPGSLAGLVEPNGIAFDRDETTLLIADVAGHRLRALNLNDEVITTLAGTGRPVHQGDNGPASEASLHGPRAVDVGVDGTIYVLERNGNTLRTIDREGIIRTIAGTGERGYSGDGGLGINATFDGPKELQLTATGAFIVDTENQVIRRFDLETGIITTVAGNGNRGPSGDGGPALQAELDRPHGVALGPDEAIYIGDTNNHRIRRVIRP